MVAAIRREELRKVPGVAETLDWAAALARASASRICATRRKSCIETLMCLLKTHEDRARMTREVTERLLGKVA